MWEDLYITTRIQTTALAIPSNKFLTPELILTTAAIVHIHLHQEAIPLAQVHQVVAAVPVHLEVVAVVAQLVRAEVAIKS